MKRLLFFAFLIMIPASLCACSRSEALESQESPVAAGSAEVVALKPVASELYDVYAQTVNDPPTFNKNPFVDDGDEFFTEENADESADTDKEAEEAAEEKEKATKESIE